MGSRVALHNILVSILGTTNVYFQPPASFQMSYPCIVYNFSKLKTKFASNKPYNHKKQYSITVIDQNPDTLIPDKVAELPECLFDRTFQTDQLNHYVFTITY